MENVYWLLLLIIVILLIGGYIFSLRYYGNLKKRVSTKLKDSRNQSFEHRETLWRYNKDYLDCFFNQDAGKYGLLAQVFQRNFEKAQESNLNGLQKQQMIGRSLPKREKISLRYILGGFGRVKKWWQANRAIDQLQTDIKGNENQIKDVERSLQALKDLPMETATLARNTRKLCRETAELLDRLSNEDGLTGKTMEESVRFVRAAEKDLETVPLSYFNSTPGELASLPDIQSETLEALRILEPAWKNLNTLNKQTKEWMAKVEELRKTAGILDDQRRETAAIFNRIIESLILPGEQEEISSLCQKADQIKTNLTALTVESLVPTLQEAKYTQDGFTLLTHTLKEYEAQLEKLLDLISKNEEQLEVVGNTMNTASTRQAYPVDWTASQIVYDDIQEKLASIRPFSEKRMPVDLVKHVNFAQECYSSLLKLQEVTNRVVAELDQLSRLWMQIQPLYTREWLAGIEQLFSEVKSYDLEVNWEPADRVSSLCSDAGELLRKAGENMPSETSTRIAEQDVHPRLLAAQDLAEKMPIFETRKARIETRLKQIQQDESEAVSLHKRISPVVSRFAREIRSINIPTKYAQNILAADVSRVALGKALDQKDKGNVSKKLREIHTWERSTAENGAMVYRWVEEDLLKRKVSISAGLREIESFAKDLEDDIVVQAHKYDLVFAPRYLDIELIKKQPLDAIEGESVKLFNEWQEVVECQGEFRKFIAPIREEYDEMLVTLKRLKENSMQLEKNLNRNWPVVFQTAWYLREKVNNLESDIDEIRKVKWKGNALQRNYYFLRQRLRDLGSEADNIRWMDEQDAASMQVLEKEYQNTIRDYAHKVYAGNEAGVRREIATGDAFLNSLVKQYRDGRKNGTNTHPASEIKAQLQRKIETYKQQLADYNIARMDDSMLERERKRQFMPTGKEIPTPLSKSEFITTLFRIIMDLEKISNQHLDIDEAVEELRSAQAEAYRNRPDSSKLKLLLKSVKGTLVDVEKTVPEVAPVIDAITMLTGVLKNIFG